MSICDKNGAQLRANQVENQAHPARSLAELLASDEVVELIQRAVLLDQHLTLAVRLDLAETLWNMRDAIVEAAL